jgi:hypothetical protein
MDVAVVDSTPDSSCWGAPWPTSGRIAGLRHCARRVEVFPWAIIWIRIPDAAGRTSRSAGHGGGAKREPCAADICGSMTTHLFMTRSRARNPCCSVGARPTGTLSCGICNTSVQSADDLTCGSRQAPWSTSRLRHDSSSVTPGRVITQQFSQAQTRSNRRASLSGSTR